MVTAPTLDTPRLRLRAHRVEDFERYAAMWTEPAVVRFIGGAAFSREAAWSRFVRHCGMWPLLGFGYFAIEDRATGAVIGETGFQDLRRGLTPSIEGTMEAGWMLSTEYHGRGLAMEATRAALAWAASSGTGERITCIISPDNAASLNVAGKLGFSAFASCDYNGRAVVMMDRPRQ